MLAAEEPARRWLRGEWLALRAELQLALGAWEPARQAAHEAAAAGASADALALLDLRAASGAGDAEGVARALNLLRVESPDSGPAAEAERLVGAAHGLSQLDPGDLARRWGRWSGRGGAAGVSAECAPLLAGLEGKAPDRARAWLECGKALSTMRRPEAQSVLRKAAAGDKTVRAAALLATARVQARGDDPGPVAATCRELGATHARDESAECDFLAAFLRLNHGEREQGRRELEAIVTRHRGHARALDAAWFLAFDDLRDAPGAARARFDALVHAARDAQEKAQGLYWRARARPPEEATAARADWREAALIDPYGYYGWLAASRLGATPEQTASDASAPPVAPALVASAAPAGARLAAALLATGFLRYAALELGEAVSPGRADALAWVPFLAAAGQFEMVLRIGQAQGGAGQPWPPAPGKRAAVEAAFPMAFPEALGQLPPTVEPQLVLALMRRESRYDPGATSAAQARGLLQLLPKTAAMLATALGEPVPPDEHLHEPALNVHLAARYIEQLQARFCQPLLVAAAYNAGPRAAARWATDNAGLEVDEWVERIPFRETRAYVKAVGAAYAAYGLLYGGRRPALSFAPVKPPGAGVDY